MLNYIRKYLLHSANLFHDRLAVVMQPPKLKKGKGKNKTAHTPTGVAKARRAAKKMRNKQHSK
ncbi:hypothetical protein A9G42_01910 [Gilliamella sp. Nev6-6]|uniref:hypothetical protein n=1 Tax=Gilliamella sp. Nev6-6 TaxID=3120252 RepID=UPI00080F3863|nr:hypothetical protein [Gilliamella apicola]OCG78789.1 hypothetical protein A9G42_01910 [Gilliamella apicola]